MGPTATTRPTMPSGVATGMSRSTPDIVPRLMMSELNQTEGSRAMTRAGTDSKPESRWKLQGPFGRGGGETVAEARARRAREARDAYDARDPRGEPMTDEAMTGEAMTGEVVDPPQRVRER